MRPLGHEGELASWIHLVGLDLCEVAAPLAIVPGLRAADRGLNFLASVGTLSQ